MTRKKSGSRKVYLPSAEEIQNELAQVETIDDSFGKEGVFSKLFARTLEEMLEAELSTHLGYEKYEALGRNSGNSRNGKQASTLQMSAGEQRIRVPRDRNGEYKSPLLEQRRRECAKEKLRNLSGAFSALSCFPAHRVN